MARPAVPLVERDLVDRMLLDACGVVLAGLIPSVIGSGHAARLSLQVCSVIGGAAAVVYPS